MKTILTLGLLSLLPLQPAKYDLLWKPKAGQKLVYGLKVDGTLADSPFLFSADAHMVVKKVEQNGSYTVGTTYKNQVTKALGETERLAQDPEEVLHFDAKGRSLDPEDEKEEADALAEIIGRAGEFEKPLKPVGIGESWKHEFPADKKLGLMKSTATYKLVSLSEGQLRVSMDYVESVASEPTKIKGMVAIRESDGAPILVESTIENARVMDGMPPAKLRLILKLK